MKSDFTLRILASNKRAHFSPAVSRMLQDRAPVKPGKAFTGTDAHSLAEQVNHLAGLLEVHAQPVQRLFFGERFAATQTAIALHCEVFVFESAKLLQGLTVTAMTRHLTFHGQDISYACILKDTQPIGLWPLVATPFVVEHQRRIC